MDPTIQQAFTIRPEDWAALFQGITEGMLYGFTGVACALVVLTALMACLGRRGEPGAAPEALSDEVWRPAGSVEAGGATSTIASAPPRGLGGIAPAVLGPRRTHARRWHRRVSRARVA